MQFEEIIGKIKQRPANSRFAKAGVSCFHENLILYLYSLLPITLNTNKPRLRKAPKRYQQANQEPT